MSDINPHVQELVFNALKEKDAFRTAAIEANRKLTLAETEVQRFKIVIEGLEAKVVRLIDELEDEKANNAMLQRMLKKLVNKG
jgi:hypothetical protein